MNEQLLPEIPSMLANYVKKYLLSKFNSNCLQALLMIKNTNQFDDS